MKFTYFITLLPALLMTVNAAAHPYTATSPHLRRSLARAAEAIPASCICNIACLVCSSDPCNPCYSCGCTFGTGAKDKREAIAAPEPEPEPAAVATLEERAGCLICNRVCIRCVDDPCDPCYCGCVVKE